MQRRAVAKRRRQAARQVPRTPPPVEGRTHADTQTETFLEVLVDRPVEEEVGTQTDAAMDRPPLPLYVPKKLGVDAETQVEVGELFDFNFEVEPILEVLCGKALEQSLMEVLEEEELAAIRAHQEEFEQIRAQELAEVQRLEAEARRKEAERRRRKEQEMQRLRREETTRAKVAAIAFARQFVGQVRDSVFGRLATEGHFYDPVTREMEEKVMPKLLASAEAKTDSRATARRLADDLIRRALQLRAERAEAEQQRKREEANQKVVAEREAREAAAAEAERIRLEEEEKRKREEDAAAAEGDEDGDEGDEDD